MLVIENRNLADINKIYLFNFVPKNEFYAVLLWYKYVSYIWLKCINWKRIVELINFIKSNKLYYRIFENEGTKVLLYWKNKKYLDLFNEYLKKSEDDKDYEFGKLLGYPKCCVYKHINCIRKTWYIFDNVKCLKEISDGFYQLNNVGIVSGRGKIQKFTKYKYIFNDALSFITWNVCSYKCKNSYYKAKKLEEFLKRYDKEYLIYLYNKTKVNYIYRSLINFLAFKKDIKLDQPYSLKDVYYGIISDKELAWLFKNSRYWIVRSIKDSIFVEFVIDWNDSKIINWFKLLNFL